MSRDINNPNENYYLLLGLDYEKPETDKAVIEAAIEKSRNEWSKLLNIPGKGNVMQKHIAEIPEMKRVLLLEGLSGDALTEGQKNRREEADAAKKLVNKAIDDAISKMVGENEIPESRITKLVELINKKHSLKITNETFIRRLPSGITVTNENKAAETAKTPKLDAVTRKSLENNLSIIKKDSIYDFLDVAPDCSQQTLLEQAESAYSDYSKKDKNKPVNVASSELSGICMTFAKDDKKRDAYNEYLKEKQLDAIKEDVEYAITGATSLSVNQTDNFVQQIMNKMKCSQNIAIEYLKKLCNGRCSIEIPKEFTSSTVYVRCGICGTVVKKGTKNCPDCGSALEIACPQCGTVNETTNNSCTKCGYSFKNALLAKKYIDESFKCMEAMDLDGAESKLGLAKHYDAGNKDIGTLEAKIKGARSVVGNSISDIETLISEKKFNAAKNAIITIERKVSGLSLDEYKSIVKAAIREAEAWYEKARNAANEKEVIEYASRALGVCSDHADARAVLMTHPPMPISNFRGKPTDSSILLRWNESTSDGVVYILVRKENAAPQNEKDGTKIGEYSSTSAEDITPEPGKQYYYTIFTSRAGITSPGVSTQTPLCCYSNLKEVSFIGADKSAVISWTLPKNAEGVEIWRKQDTSPERGEGQKIPSSGKSVEDKNLENGKTYYYSVFTIYRCNGAVVYSTGITGKVSPSEPIKPIESFEVKKLDTNVFGIKWGVVEKGSMVLYFSKDKKGFSRGEIRERSFIEANLSILPTVFKNEEKAKASVEPNAIYYVYPIIFNGEIGTFCSSFVLNNVSDVTDIEEPSINNDSLYLKFSWPAKANRVFVAYKANEYAKSYDDSSAECEIFTKEQFDSYGGVVIKGIERRNYYLTVFAVYGNEEPPICSGGVGVIAYNCPQIEVSYSVKQKKGLFAKKNTFTISVEAREKCKLPKMKLVRKNGPYPPLSISDGISVADVEFAEADNKFTYEFSDTFFGTSCFKLFFENEADYRLYKLMATSTKEVTITK